MCAQVRACVCVRVCMCVGRLHLYLHVPSHCQVAENLVQRDGDFLVCDSLSSPGCYVLTSQWRNTAQHFKINKKVTFWTIYAVLCSQRIVSMSIFVLFEVFQYNKQEAISCVSC